MRKRAWLAFFMLPAIMLTACMPGIVVTRQTPTAQGAPVEFRLGNTVETEEWVTFQKQVCRDLPEATAGLPEDTRQAIYRDSCMEPDRHALGETLAKLPPDEVSELCDRLARMGYVVKKDEFPTRAGEIGVLLGIAVILAL